MTATADDPLSITLRREFGAKADEVRPMVQAFVTLAYSLGYPPGCGKGAGEWMIRAGYDPNAIWRYALDRVRGGEVAQLH